MASVVVLIAAIPGIIYGFIAHGSFIPDYAFTANFIAAAILIAGGLLYPYIPNRVLKSIKSNQLFEYKMHMEYMEERAKKRMEGYHIMWTGFATALIAGLIEILIW